MSDAVAAGEIAAGYVVLSEQKELKPLQQLSIDDLIARLTNIKHREGQYGDFWWVNEQLSPAGNGRFAATLY